MKHGYAARSENARGEMSTLVILTSDPIDVHKVADAFDPGFAVSGQMDSNKPGGYVRICVAADGSECGLYYSHDQPSSSLNLSGSGEFKLDLRNDRQIKGHWSQKEPSDFFGKAIDFDLVFDTPLTAPAPGTRLPADGGEPGTALKAYFDALAKGDVPALHRLLGEDARWQLPADDQDRAKEGLKDLRDGKPVSPKIVSGVQRGDQAVLRIEGVDRDDIKRVGRVLMVKEGGTWRLGRTDLVSATD
ncbi:MAG: nuclear transport factor 2 family protein [Lysobacterales bacterium]